MYCSVSGKGNNLAIIHSDRRLLRRVGSPYPDLFGVNDWFKLYSAKTSKKFISLGARSRVRFDR